MSFKINGTPTTLPGHGSANNAACYTVTSGHMIRGPHILTNHVRPMTKAQPMVTHDTDNEGHRVASQSTNGNHAAGYRHNGESRESELLKSDEDSQSLLCSEIFSSPTPPGVEGTWSWQGEKHTNGGTTLAASDQHQNNNNSSIHHFTHNRLTLKDGQPTQPIITWVNGCASLFVDAKSLGTSQPKDLLLKAALLGVSSGNIINQTEASEGKDINSNIETKCAAKPSGKFVGNDVDSRQRMSGSNGYDRNRMTGSSTGSNNDSLGRLTDASVSAGQPQPLVTPAEGMLMPGHLVRSGALGLHEGTSRSIITGAVGAGPHVTGSVFRPPQSVSDTGRYPVTFTTAAGTSGPYSPQMTSHGGGSFNPYVFYNSQYAGYNPSVIHGPIDPQFGSYSAVLQSMGSHAVSQVPRSPYSNSAGSASTISQLQLLNMQQASPGSGKAYLGNSERDESKFRRDQQQEFDIQRRHSTTGIIKEEQTHHYSGPTDFIEPTRQTVAGLSRESPAHKRELSSSVSDIYKVPSGREGSLKHRILRPSDASSSVSILGNPQQSAFINTEEPAPKRTKTKKETERESQAQSAAMGGGENVQGVSGYPPPPNSHLQYPQHFMKGSIIQLANGDLKRVEDLETSDFVQSAEISSDLKIDSSTVVQIEANQAQGTAVLSFVVGEHKVKVTVEATVEHPFFVFGQGWSSCEPEWTSKRYGLDCHRLTVGDVCISLTHKDVTARAAEISQQQQQQQQNKLEGCSVFRKDSKIETTSAHTSPGGRNKSPGHGSSPSVTFASSTQQHSVRSDSRDSSRHTHESSVKDEHLFTPPTSQIALSSSQAQEQKSRPSSATTAT